MGSQQMPTAVKRRYFELISQGRKGAEAARRVGVSTSCGSKFVLASDRDFGRYIFQYTGPTP